MGLPQDTVGYPRTNDFTVRVESYSTLSVNNMPGHQASFTLDICLPPTLPRLDLSGFQSANI
jgi:hypothetical protein